MSFWHKLSHQRGLVQVGVSAAIATAVVLTTTYWFARQRRLKQSRKTSAKSAPVVPPCPSGVPPTVWRAFEQAVQRIHTLTTRKTKRLRLKSGDKLMLYAIYKQATLGDAPHKFDTTASWNVMVEKAKHDAWCRMRGMSQEEAAVHYITAVAGLEQECGLENDDDDGGGGDDDQDEGEGDFGMGGPAVSRPVEDVYRGEDSNSPQAKFLSAASNNNVDLLQQLLRENKNISVDYADESGQTALHMAADRGSLASVKFLLDNGANIRALDKDQISVLQAAVISGHVETCRYLLAHGADPDHEDVDGDTPRSCAEDDGSPEMLELFFEAETQSE